MKKLIVLLLALLLLSGCTAATKSKPSIRPADLTESEQALLRMFGLNYPRQVFDFTAPEGAVGVIIRRQQLVEGEWVATKHYLRVDGKTGRIAISFDQLADGLRCAIQQEGNAEATSVTRQGTATQNFTSTAMITLSADTEAALDVEIPLLVQVHTDDLAITSPRINAYPDAAAFSAYDEVYVVTAAFTDKELE